MFFHQGLALLPQSAPLHLDTSPRVFPEVAFQESQIILCKTDKCGSDRRKSLPHSVLCELYFQEGDRIQSCEIFDGLSHEESERTVRGEQLEDRGYRKGMWLHKPALFQQTV